MRNLLDKELRLATPLLTFLFLSFTAMTFIPGYPILCGAFFVCFGIFQGYQFGREHGDVLYTVLLPVRKKDVVKAKYAAAVVLQMLAFALFCAFVGVRMVFLADAQAYETNALMGANPTFLAFVMLIFAAFNAVFIGGFFRTAYGIGKPFTAFAVAAFVIIGIGETLHHLPGLEWLNARSFPQAGRQLPVLLAAVCLYAVATAISCRRSQCRFEQIDL